MKWETFEKVTSKDQIKEGDYVYIVLSKPFLLKEIKYAQERAAGPQPKQKKSKKGCSGGCGGGGCGKGCPPATPNIPQPNPSGISIPGAPSTNFVVDPPGFVFGYVEEVLPSLLYLSGAYEERSKIPAKNGYEFRECSEIRKIAKDQYDLLIHETLN